MTNEIWKDIEGFEGKYQVSSFGRIKSLYQQNQYTIYYKETIIKPSFHNQGYLKVTLFNRQSKKICFIHRLVAQAFIPNLDNKPEVNHINEIKSDNRVENLEWCDAKYNSNYGTKIERHRKLISKPIIQTTLDGVFIRKIDSASEAEKKFGYKASYISLVCHNRRKSAYGYRFHFEYNNIEKIEDKDVN